MNIWRSGGMVVWTRIMPTADMKRSQIHIVKSREIHIVKAAEKFVNMLLSAYLLNA